MNVSIILASGKNSDYKPNREFWNVQLVLKVAIIPTIYFTIISEKISVDLDNPQATFFDLKTNLYEKNDVKITPDSQTIYHMGYRIDDDNLLLNDVISVNGNDEFILLLPKAVNKFLIIGRYRTAALAKCKF